jgi:hypothetical protein
VYRVNSKNLALKRLMPRGPNAEPRLKYLHVSAAGTTIVAPDYVARVSLPLEARHGLAPDTIYSQDDIDEVKPPKPEGLVERLVDLPEGEPAIDSPRHMVPNIEAQFFEPEQGMPDVIINGDKLRKMLTVACEVCEDSGKAMRIRFDMKTNRLRIDTYALPEDQSFVGVMKGMRFTGSFIGGEVSDKSTKSNLRPASGFQQGHLVLKRSVGRKFRGEGE